MQTNAPAPRKKEVLRLLKGSELCPEVFFKAIEKASSWFIENA